MTTKHIRNIGIVAHVDAGKTTLSERILLYTGRIRNHGEVHTGNTALDDRRDEQAKGITIGAATVRCEWGDHAIHLVDTPGHVDFTIEVARSLRVLDGVVVVLDGVAGVEPQTETVWRQARLHSLPALLFVNKLDRPGASFARCVAEFGERLGTEVAVVSLPIVEDDSVVGVLDLVRERLLIWEDDEGRTLRSDPIPERYAAIAREAREALVETAALADASLLEAWLSGTVDEDALLGALRRGTIEELFVPALGGSAYRNRGVQPLLDAVVDYLPSPLDRGPVESLDGHACRPPDPSAPLAALCFKVVHDRYGALSFVRVYSGTLREGGTVRHTRLGRDVRIGRLVRLFAGQREAIQVAQAGEIAGVIGGDWATGDTLSDPAHPIVLEAIEAPEPVALRALEPCTRKDRDRLGEALRRLLVEDPSLRLRSDPETGQTLLAGMGELHLEIAVGRLASDHQVDVRVGEPRVAYRETVRARVSHEVKHKKQSGGPGQFAHIVAELGPAARDEGLRFADRTVGGAVPKPFAAATRKGCLDGMVQGPLGFPVVDLEIDLLDGSFHPNDSHERDFQIAGARLIREACRVAGPVLLEPWMALEVSAPDESLGDVLGDLASRRARILGMRAEAGRQLVTAELPLSETFGYAGQLAGLTHGRGAHSMKPLGYEAVPEALVASAVTAA
ncbi:MAG: elongation factor G [Myxococcota bacterium]